METFEKLNNKQRQVFAVYGTNLLFTLLFTGCFFWRIIAKGFPMDIVCYETIILLTIFLSGHIFLLIKFPFLRFGLGSNEKNKEAKRWRFTRSVLKFFAVLSMTLIVVQLALKKIDFFFFHEISTFFLFLFAIFMIGKFFIPAAKNYKEDQ